MTIRTHWQLRDIQNRARLRFVVARVPLACSLILVAILHVLAAVPVEGAPIPAAVRKTVDDGHPIWVFFHDKGPASVTAKLAGRAWISPRAQERVARRGAHRDAARDWPVYTGYTDQLTAAGMTIRTESRWLNAVSGTISPGQLDGLSTLECVKSVQPVARYQRRRPDDSDAQPPIRKPSDRQGSTRFDYGTSAAQIQAIQADWLHAVGLDGASVMIGFLDTGYDLGIKAFDSLAVAATWDFINQDPDVGDRDAGQMNHGTATVSVCGGFSPGELIGVAPRAEYALAKTELDGIEEVAEEDYWVAGLAWLDSLGCDLASSSLGYTDWYTYAQMDGNTAVTTVAADMAAERGLLVVNSAGNEGIRPWHYMIAPADGDSTLAVGATTLSGIRAPFSSQGPTADGRVKPDVMAPGVGVWSATVNSNLFSGRNGTSFSAPLVTGVCALLLQQNPALTPNELIELLRRTATNADSPDTLMGWGIVQAARAAGLPETLLVAWDDEFVIARDSTLELASPGVLGNDFSSSTGIAEVILLSDAGAGELFFSSDGSFQYTPDSGFVGVDSFTYAVTDGVSESQPGTVRIRVVTSHEEMRVELWPNPMADSVRVVLPALDPSGPSSFWIYTTSGQLVYRQEFTGYSAIWRGQNDDGGQVASGVYLVLVQTPARQEIVKLAVLRQ